MSVYSYKDPGKNMAVQATLQTKLACGTLTMIIINVCVLIAVIAFISKYEMCKIYQESTTSNSKGRSKIKRFQSTTITENPWMLAFIIYPENHLIGTGTIISKNWALTTSDCEAKASKYPISKMAFRGATSFWNEDGLYHFLEKLIPHEKFDPHTLDYNIALGRVAHSFTYKDEAPLSIASENFNLLEGESAEVVGWFSETDNSDEYSLAKNKVRIISEKKCVDTLTRAKHRIVPQRCICTYSNTTGEENCNFASGGALIANHRLVGLVSWGVTCSTDNNWPGVYVKISRVFSWIQDIKSKETVP